MKASEIMTHPVFSVRADASVREASALLAEHRITSMPVLDDNGDVVGIVSELDLLRNRFPHDPRAHLTRYDEPASSPGRLVRDVMSDVVFCLSENADAADVVELMVTNRVRAVPIISGADLVGIVSRRDLLRALIRDDADVLADVRERLAGYTSAGEECDDVAVTDGVVTVSGHFSDEQRRAGAIALLETVPGVARVHIERR
jgi:CBS-domain-containing membrane protein